MRFLAKCEGCKKTRLFIRRQKIKLPIGSIATSQKLLCGRCILAVRKAIELV